MYIDKLVLTARRAIIPRLRDIMTGVKSSQVAVGRKL